MKLFYAAVLILNVKKCLGQGQSSCDWLNFTDSEWTCDETVDSTCNFQEPNSTCYCYSIYNGSANSDNEWNERKCNTLSRNRCYPKCWKGCRWSCNIC